MKIRKLKIDWQELEEAFSRKQHDIVSYLDRVNGSVVLEGEGEEEDHHVVSYGSSGAPVAPAPRKDDATRKYIRPPSTERKVGWLEHFLDKEEGLDAEAVAQLREALTAPEPAARIIEILRQNPEVSDAWYDYRADRVREMIDEWLAADGIESVEPPPWRS
jgi:hypothetical protein